MEPLGGTRSGELKRKASSVVSTTIALAISPFIAADTVGNEKEHDDIVLEQMAARVFVALSFGARRR